MAEVPSSSSSGSTLIAAGGLGLAGACCLAGAGSSCFEFDPLKLQSRELNEVSCERPAGSSDSGADVQEWDVGAADPVPPPCDGSVVGKFGIRFRWTAHHLLPSQLQPLRQQGDTAADAVLDALELRPDVDVVERLARPRVSNVSSSCGAEAEPVALRELRRECWEVPAWVDWDEIERGQVRASLTEDSVFNQSQPHHRLDTTAWLRLCVHSWGALNGVRAVCGQDVFMRHLVAGGLSLYYISLVGGFSAPLITRGESAFHLLSSRLRAALPPVPPELILTPRSVRAPVVLTATGYLTSRQPKRVLRRLRDTGSLIVDCVRGGRAALKPGGAGWVAALRVRFLHAQVRRRLLMAKAPHTWDAEAL
eukprot:SAG11_NODE_396_length_9806_cov_37.601855_2_plen_365_part_00